MKKIKGVKKGFVIVLLFMLMLTGCINNSQNKSGDTISEGQLNVYFIDVGQADSILVCTSNKTMLIDAGNNKDGKEVVSFINNLGITKIDFLIGTHPDADHIGGLDNVIKSFEIGKIFMTKKQSNTKTFEDVLLAIKEKGLNITSPTVGDTFLMDEAKITIVGPASNYEDSNSNSIVLQLQYGQQSFLFTGDATKEAEADMLKQNLNLAADVLKVGHHGSSTSTSQEFLETVHPQYAIISCGKDNKYGHPHKEVLELLEEENVKVHRTDLEQTILITTDGSTLEIKTGLASAIGNENNSTTSQQSNIKTEDNVEQSYYIGNKNSKKLHLPSCSSIPIKKNQVIFKTKEEALEEGYEECTRCNP